MTQAEFDEFCGEGIPCALFHVSHTDIDSETGGRLEEVILAQMIGHTPECLKYKPLQWFIDTYLGKSDLSDEVDYNDDYLNWVEYEERMAYLEAEVEYYKNNPPPEPPLDLFAPSTEEELWMQVQNDERVTV